MVTSNTRWTEEHSCQAWDIIINDPAGPMSSPFHDAFDPSRELPPQPMTSHPPVILLPSPTTTSSARQCMPRVHVLPPCVADYPIFYITCITRRQAPSCSFSPTSILRPLSLDHLPSSLLPITARLVSHSHWPIAFQSRTLGLLPGYPCVTMSPSIPVPPGPLSTAVPSS